MKDAYFLSADASSAPQSPLKQAGDIKESPPPPPTADAAKPTSATNATPNPPRGESSIASKPESPEKTSLSALSEGDEANILTGNALVRLVFGIAVTTHKRS